MKITIDTEANTLTQVDGAEQAVHSLYTPEALDVITRFYQNTGWHLKASYGFSWLGTPIVQLPEDLLRLQEAIWQVKPTVIIETGVSRGGSVLFYASLCHLFALFGHPCRVIGVDHNMWPETRENLQVNPLSRYITLVHGDSKSPETVEQVQSHVAQDDKVFATLDSAHDKAHVLAELETYGPLVSVGSYMVVQDGLMKHVTAGPRSRPDWTWNNPEDAAREFLEQHPEFVEHPPERVFTQSRVSNYPTQWPYGWLKRLV